LDGPLKEREGAIIRLNRRQRCAEVLLATEGIRRTIWLSYEVMEVKEGTT